MLNAKKMMLLRKLKRMQWRMKNIFQGERKKVFGIGMFKTGTTSLGRALDILGYNTLHGPWGTKRPDMLHDAWYERPDEWSKYWDTIKLVTTKYDAFQDYPWMFCFEKCYEWYPDAKFVLTARDAMAVADSDANMWNTPIEKLKEDGTYQRFIDRYNSQYTRAVEFFRDKENFLILRIADGEGWDELCPFLECDKPNIPFPHTHKGNYKK